ncbi:hypothetical protein DFQ27_001528 [Actinomortierella ambigua]|uniref:F-box domain-containing protein n=1 Tax=Actinomortierella ambigua TaxID=1343610 RepID=A0A9P6QCC6_9FUNG|nr:hypothetical protein DFQ27_001528 [Actinomortierella ambigua]
MDRISPFQIPEIAAQIAEFLTLDDLDSCLVVCKQWYSVFVHFTGRHLETSCRFRINKEGYVVDDLDVLRKRLKRLLEPTNGRPQPALRSFKFHPDKLKAFTIVTLSGDHTLGPAPLPEPLSTEIKDLLLLSSRHLARLYIHPYPGIDWSFVLQLITGASKLKELIWTEGALAAWRHSILDVLRTPCGAHLLRLELVSIAGLTWNAMREIGNLCPRLRDLILHKGVMVDQVICSSAATTTTWTDSQENRSDHLQHSTAGLERRLRSPHPVAERRSPYDHPYRYTQQPVFPALRHLEIHETQARVMATLLSHTPFLTSATLPLYVFSKGAVVMDEAMVIDGCGQFLKSLALIGWCEVEAADGSESDVLKAIHLTRSLPLECITLQDARVGSQTVLEITRHHAKTLKTLKISDAYRISNRVVQGLLIHSPKLEELEIRPVRVGSGGSLLNLASMLSTKSKPWACRGLRVFHVPLRLPELICLQRQLPMEKRNKSTDMDMIGVGSTPPSKRWRAGSGARNTKAIRASNNNIAATTTTTTTTTITTTASTTRCLCIDARHRLRKCPQKHFFERVHALKHLQSITFYQDCRQTKRYKRPNSDTNSKRLDEKHLHRLRMELPTTCKGLECEQASVQP